MIRDHLTLDYEIDREYPVELLAATELVLEHTVLNHDAMLHLATASGYVLTIGRRSALKFYDLDKLRDEGVFVHEREFGGSGALYGPGDVLFTLQVNKGSFVDGYDVDVKQAYRFFNEQLCTVIDELGVSVYLDESVKIGHPEDGVCAHLQGRSEIRSTAGNARMAASVYREDEVGFYMRGVVLVTGAWQMIYQYLDPPTPPMLPLDSIMLQLDADRDMRDEIMESILVQFAKAFRHQRLWEQDNMRAIYGIKDRFRVLK